MSVLYNHGKANVVADALSQISIGIVIHVDDVKIELVKEVHRLARLGARLKDTSKGGFMIYHNSESSLVVELKCKQHIDPILMDLKELGLSKHNESFSQGRGVCLGIMVCCVCRMLMT